ncbi:hypothetical protein CPB86DRAFT_350595 [Serendipita vermifera]|nr:hypothetical protein CPB86DRAFT_350595 [Serendipita vermifera]
MCLIRANSLYHGVRLGTGKASEDHGPEHSPHLLINPPDSLLWVLDDSAGVEVTTLSSERNTTYVRQGWVKGAATFQSPFASASVEANSQEMQAQASGKKTVFVTGIYRYQRAIIEFDPDSIVLSKAFLDGLENALQKSSDKQKTDSLHTLFKKYGHVFPLRVVLGGALVTTQKAVVENEDTENRAENSVKFAINAAIGGWGGGASANIGSKTDGTSDDKNGWASNTFSVKGGDSLQLTTVDKWIPSVAPFKNWRVIKTEKVIDVRDLIPEKIRARVLRLDPKPKPLRGCWVNCISWAEPGNPPYKSGFPSIFPASGPGQKPWYHLGPTIYSPTESTNKILLV